MTAAAFTWCRACQTFRDPGDLLEVRPLDGSAVFHVCRPSGRPECFRTGVPRAALAEIALADPEGARMLDRKAGGSSKAARDAERLAMRVAREARRAEYR